MTFALARKVLSQEDSDASCQLLFDHEEQLVWDEYGDEVERFNAIAMSYPGTPAASIDGAEADVRMTYRGATVQVPVEYDREDNLRAVHTLSQLTKADIEFRLCRETSGNSERGFIVLPPAQWRELEREFGTDAVTRRFLPLAPGFDVFAEEAFAESEDDMSEQELAVKRFAEAVEGEASKVAPCEVVRGTDENDYVDLLLITETNTQRDRLFKDAGFRAVLDGQVKALQAQGMRTKCVAIESFETANEHWHGLFMEPALRASSPHIWFNRGPADRQSLWRRAISRFMR